MKPFSIRSSRWRLPAAASLLAMAACGTAAGTESAVSTAPSVAPQPSLNSSETAPPTSAPSHARSDITNGHNEPDWATPPPSSLAELFGGADAVVMGAVTSVRADVRSLDGTPVTAPNTVDPAATPETPPLAAGATVTIDVRELLAGDLGEAPHDAVELSFFLGSARTTADVDQLRSEFEQQFLPAGEAMWALQRLNDPAFPEFAVVPGYTSMIERATDGTGQLVLYPESAERARARVREQGPTVGEPVAGGLAPYEQMSAELAGQTFDETIELARRQG